MKSGNQCDSACAIAFLGGVARGVASSGFGRRLQIGAKLGFHGFSTSDPSKVVVLKHAFDAARVINAVIVQYAHELGGVNLALLSELISVDPTDIRTVATPRELRGLSITVVGSLPPRPADWALNACTRAVEAHRPIRDVPLAERISASSQRMRIGTMDDLRQAVLSDRFRVDGGRNREIQAALAGLSNDEFFSVAAGLYRPKLPIERIRLGRGAGFYFDQCYAIEGYAGPQTLLIDGVGGLIVDTHHGDLGWYSDRKRLW